MHRIPKKKNNFLHTFCTTTNAIPESVYSLDLFFIIGVAACSIAVGTGIGLLVGSRRSTKPLHGRNNFLLTRVAEPVDHLLLFNTAHAGLHVLDIDAVSFPYIGVTAGEDADDYPAHD